MGMLNFEIGRKTGGGAIEEKKLFPKSQKLTPFWEAKLRRKKPGQIGERGEKKTQIPFNGPNFLSPLISSPPSYTPRWEDFSAAPLTLLAKETDKRIHS